MSYESQIYRDCGVAIYRNYWVKIISYDCNRLVETNQEINQLNIEFRLELLKCHFAANSQQGRVINWLRVLQISKEILAIDEFNVNACVSKKGGIVSLILYSRAPSFNVVSIWDAKSVGGHHRGLNKKLRNLQWRLRINLIWMNFIDLKNVTKNYWNSKSKNQFAILYSL